MARVCAFCGLDPIPDEDLVYFLFPRDKAAGRAPSSAHRTCFEDMQARAYRQENIPCEVKPSK